MNIYMIWEVRETGLDIGRPQKREAKPSLTGIYTSFNALTGRHIVAPAPSKRGLIHPRNDLLLVL